VGPPSPELNTGAKAGIGSGVAVGVILLAIIALLYMKLKKRMNVNEEAVHTSRSGDLEKEGPIIYTREAEPVEMLAERVPLEMMSQRDVAELPSSQGVQRTGGFAS
jgi:H+/gluconate symporter-like permease